MNLVLKLFKCFVFKINYGVHSKCMRTPIILPIVCVKKNQNKTKTKGNLCRKLNLPVIRKHEIYHPQLTFNKLEIVIYKLHENAKRGLIHFNKK